MQTRPRVRFAVRRYLIHTLAISAVAIVLCAGCGGHRRGSMRPVFIGPSAPPAVVEGPATVIDEPAPSPLPGFSEEEPLLTPAPAPASPAPSGRSDSGVRRSSGDEPPLNPSTPGASPPANPPAGSGNSGNSDNGLRLDSPSARRVPSRSNVVKPAVRELRGRVAGFVNDPADLFNPPKADRTWRYIVLHHSAHETGSYAQIDREHRERLGTQGCGYHFVIGNGSDSPDGQVEVATRWSDQMGGAHCRDAKSPEMNEYGIGICLIGDLEKKPPTARQVEAARTLISYLQARYEIPTEDIGTHRDFSGTKTACPGDHFPMAILETRESVAKFSSLLAK